MTPLIKYLLFQGLIIIPFLAGYYRRHSFKSPDLLSKKLVNFNLVFLEPPVVLWTIWGLDFFNDLIYLPAAAVLLVLAGMLSGYIFSPIPGLTGKRKAVFLISSGMANHGFTMGGFICYIFLGEKGLGLASIFTSYFMPFLFLVIFPFARFASKGRNADIKESLFTLRNMPFYAFIIAVVLHILGIKRSGYFPVELFLMISIPLYYFTLGFTFRTGNIMGMIKSSSSLAFIKFFLLPLITFAVLGAFDIDASVRAVILIQSFMPAAIYSVVSSILFDLESEFASGLFVINTVVFIIAVLPVLFFFGGKFLYI